MITQLLLKESQLSLRVWKIFIFFVISITLVLRLANLNEKAYNADEVRSFYRLSGYTKQEVIEQLFNSDIVGVEELQAYQRPTPERDLKDAIRALARNSEHPPLYYLLARFWMQCFGEPVSARVLSILISLAVLPCLYWLCLELFQLPLVGYLSILLVGISPYHILLSQGAREYSLWTLMVVLSSAAFLRALRIKTKSSWFIYAITLAVGFYSHLFFIITFLSHGIYIGITERWRLNRSTISYLLASLGGILTYFPWIVVIVTNLDQTQENVNWNNSPNHLGLAKIIQVTINNLGNIFLDFNDSTRLEKYIDFILFALVVYSFSILIRFTEAKISLFILLMIGIPVVFLMIPQLIFQGERGLWSRYYLTFYLGVQLAIAYLFYNRLNLSINVFKKRLWMISLIILLSSGLLSGIFIYQNPGWDYLDQGRTASAINLELAPLINATKQPLVISEATHSFILALSYVTDEKVKFQLFQPDNRVQWNEKFNLSKVSENFTDIFIYFPDKEFLNFINKDNNFEVKSVFKNHLYQVVKK